MWAYTVLDKKEVTLPRFAKVWEGQKRTFLLLKWGRQHPRRQRQSKSVRHKDDMHTEQKFIPFSMNLIFLTYLMLNFCRFRNCLKMVNSANADMVGRFFFNYIRIPCFIIKRKTECARWTWWGKCIKQETKETATIQQVPRYN